MANTNTIQSIESRYKEYIEQNNIQFDMGLANAHAFDLPSYKANDFIAANPKEIYLIYVTMGGSCGPCAQTAPTLAELAQELNKWESETDNDIKVIAFNNSLCAVFSQNLTALRDVTDTTHTSQLNGYPTIIGVAGHENGKNGVILNFRYTDFLNIESAKMAWQRLETIHKAINPNYYQSTN